MKLSTCAFSATLSAPLFLSFALIADDISFHPAGGSEVVKTLKWDMEANVKDVTLTMNGEPVPGADAGMNQLTENSILFNMLVGVTEQNVESKDGKPIDLLRTFDSLKMGFEMGENSKDFDEFKELEGKTVRFKWNEKDGAYDKSFHESEGDTDKIQQLTEDMDLRLLLPSKKVAKGDTWEVPAQELMGLLMPGGTPGSGGAGKEAEMGEKLREKVMEQLEQFFKESKVACTYQGARDEGGVQVGEIAFHFEGKAKLDLGDMIQEIIESQAPAGVPEMTIKATIEGELKGEGSCLWNIAAGRVQNHTMHSDMSFQMDMNVNMKQGDTPMDFVMAMSADAKADWALETKAPEKK